MSMRVVAGEPMPDEVAAVAAVTRALYGWISGPAGPRNATVLEELFAPGGALTFFRDGAWQRKTPAEFTAMINAALQTVGFYESATEETLSLYRDVAHVFSGYESRRSPGEQPFASGVNSIQLVRVGAEWRILSLAWSQGS